MSEPAGLERGYRRLLAWYPRAYRRENEEEILAVLLASAYDGQQQPGLAASADLIKGAMRMRLWPPARAPRTVQAAVCLMYAGVAAELASLIISVATASSVQAAYARGYPRGAAAAVHHAVTAQLLKNDAGTAIAIGGWLLLAWALGRGHNLARFAFAAFVALDSLAVLKAIGQGAAVHAPADMAAAAVVWLLILAAMVLLCTGASNRYYRQRPRAVTLLYQASSTLGGGGFTGGGSSSGSRADWGDYPALLTWFKEKTRWDDSGRLADLAGRSRHPGPRLRDLRELGPAGPLPDIGPFDRRVFAVGGIVFAVLMGLSMRYGFDRDELYFLDSARHLQASYVDQPVLAPLLAWVSLHLFGVSLSGLRLWPSFAAGATVVVAGLTAREFGGTRRAQLLAAAGTAVAPWLLGPDHLANTTPYVLLAWAALALVVVRIGRTGDCRWWLAGGLVTGLGVADDHSMGLFAIAVVIGALLSGGRPVIWNRWFAAGAVIAVAFEVPDLCWQLSHGWATIAMTEALSRENGGLGQIVPFALQQLAIAVVTLAGVSVIGLCCLCRSGRPLWRALAWAYGLLFVLFALTAGAKGYYLAATYVYLLAAGAVVIDGWLRARPARLRVVMLVTAALTAVTLPEVLPVLPPAVLARTIYTSNPTPLETIGWPQLVRTVAAVWTSLPPSQRANAVLFADNDGLAGAINELGRGTGLPTAVSRQNSEWWWGAGNPNATTIVAVTPGPAGGGAGYGAYLEHFFTSVRVAATLSNPYGIHNQQWGGHVYICTGPRRPWGQMWPQLREYT
jgi:hypothetical protein